MSLRATGEQLGNASDRQALTALMATPSFLAAYARGSKRGKRVVHAAGTLGALIDWYKTKPRYTDLAKRTKEDYFKAERFLENSLDYVSKTIEKADIVELRDEAAEGSEEVRVAAVGTPRELTLHGLRVAFGSELREQGFIDREVADMLGDLSEGMGKRYSRGAEMRKTSVRVHQRLAK